MFSEPSDKLFWKNKLSKIFLAIFENFQGSGPFFLFSYVFSRIFRKTIRIFFKCHRKILGLHLEKFGQERVPKFHGQKCSQGPKMHFAPTPRGNIWGSGTWKIFQAGLRTISSSDGGSPAPSAKMGPRSQLDSQAERKWGEFGGLRSTPTGGALRITGLISPEGQITLAARLPGLTLTLTQRQEGVPRSRE